MQSQREFIHPANMFIIFISITLFFLGQFYFINFFHFAEPTISGISFQIIEKDAPLKTSILFSLMLALIPILLAATWRLGRIVSVRIKTLSILSTIVFITIAVLLRHQMVKVYFIQVVKPAVAPNDTANFLYPIDPIRFVYYMFAGLLTGCMLTYLLSGQKGKVR